ncbi:hypothetical protein SAMN04489712_13524 [Thermomonospora echinospora]|uniref:DUF6879 domain-containing protein n=1 Tax=Thermomonospora echinospora TaxID=1992 RepID=A0A1H6E739_9ACTN|nr:DUF6879 family protein [Thermomonospora echinospora]SEG92766.1 hypothetical protein SAMN04489712_13524 [Thermomonospora echinospora]
MTDIPGPQERSEGQAQPDPAAGLEFVGIDEDSPANKCPVVLAVPGTGDLLQVGRKVTDPDALALIGEHTDIADDEAVIWTPASLKPALLAALTGTYTPGQTGPGEPSFEDLLAATVRSVVHLEARDTYDPTDPAFLKWKQDGDTSYDWDAWIALVGAAVDRGVRFRWLRIVSEPVSDYIRWEHAISYGNVKGGVRDPDRAADAGRGLSSYAGSLDRPRPGERAAADPTALCGPSPLQRTWRRRPATGIDRLRP